jgi:hypothetical protein
MYGIALFFSWRALARSGDRVPGGQRAAKSSIGFQPVFAAAAMEYKQDAYATLLPALIRSSCELVL